MCDITSACSSNMENKSLTVEDLPLFVPSPEEIINGTVTLKCCDIKYLVIQL